MGLPQVKITFQENTTNFIHRLGRGIVCIPFVDETFTKTAVVTASSAAGLDKAVESLASTKQEAVKAALSEALTGGAAKAVAVCAKDAAALKQALSGLRFNWLAVGELSAENQTGLASWAKGIDYRTGRTFIVVGGEGLVKEDDPHVVAMDETDTTNEKMSSALIAGILAGCSDRSGTYYVVDTETDGTGYATRDQAEENVDAGLLTVFYDGEKAKIGRAVTSVYAKTPASAFAKIRNVDIMDMIQDDIRASFEDSYAGQVLNSYDEKMNFIGMVNNVYLMGLEGSALDPDGVNSVDIDVEKHAELAEAAGEDVGAMTEQDLRKYPTGESVYLAGSLRLLDTMEDLFVVFAI